MTEVSLFGAFLSRMKDGSNHANQDRRGNETEGEDGWNVVDVGDEHLDSYADEDSGKAVV